ncbi:hypothetical protein BHM03_00060483, partial [Ensete ventricosum]
MASRGKLTGDVKARKCRRHELPRSLPSSDEDKESRHGSGIPNRDEARTSVGK